MVKNRWGRIINITSVVGIRGNIGQSNYSASKGAIHSFTYSLAKELATRGITVNAIAPGYIKTATVDDLPIFLYLENSSNILTASKLVSKSPLVVT